MVRSYSDGRSTRTHLGLEECEVGCDGDERDGPKVQVTGEGHERVFKRRRAEVLVTVG